MAISQRAVGAWAVSNATTQTVTLPTHATGDMLIVRTIRKPFTSPDNTVINTAGWTAVAAGRANGATANGNGTGSMGFKAFWKVATSAAETNPVVTWGTTSAPGACVAVSYQKGGAESFIAPVGDGGGDATARTSQTSTIATHVSVTSGDLVDFFRGQCDDSGVLTVPTITQASVTFNTVTEYPATAIADGTSNDIAADGGYRIATAGTSSAAAVVTGTSAASEEHGAWMTRLRVVAIQDTAPNLITQTAVIDAPTITTLNTYTPALIDQTATIADPTVIQQQFYTPALIDQTGVIFDAEITQGAPPSLGTYVEEVTADSPIVWWRLGEPSGTNANDEIGVSDGFYTNTPTLGVASLVTNHSNTAVTFSRASLEFVDATAGNMPAGSSAGVSVESWVKFASLTAATRYPIGRWWLNSPVTEMQVYYNVDAGAWRYLYQDATGFRNCHSDATTPTIGTTYHIVVTHDYSAELVNFYINGSLFSTEDVSAFGVPVVHNANGFCTIARAGSDYFDGTLDEAAIYNGVLSGARVLVHYNAGIAAAAAERIVVGQRRFYHQLVAH